MSVKVTQSSILATDKLIDSASHVLMVLPKDKPSGLPCAELLEKTLKRKRSKYADLAKAPITAQAPSGALLSWVVLDPMAPAFTRHTVLRKAVKPLLDEKPLSLAIAVFGGESQRALASSEACYVAAVNAAVMPSHKAKEKPRPLKGIAIHGWQADDAFADVIAQAEGNGLTRHLTVLPPNALTPEAYREKIAALAKTHGWQHEEFDMKRLKKMGAGAFVAVGQGSEPQDAAIVHLTYSHKSPKKHISLVGKGICFDTGGHNLKPARYMNGMHEDMNGSAVVLGILLAATQAKLPVKLDCWLAIAQNHIGPKAYKQNDVVTALNGKTIEIVHTDAEGRMVLSDTLTLASRAKPELMIDFATLTGSMITALGDRYSGVLGNRPELLCKAVGAGVASGERVNAFPFDEDYDEDLDSDIADIKQCTLDGEADHVLAARFLSKFIEHDVPWLHVDLSACRRKGGLGAVGTDVTGFGVGFTLRLIKDLLAGPKPGEQQR
jgi:leucyl aminopeptidase